MGIKTHSQGIGRGSWRLSNNDVNCIMDGFGALAWTKAVSDPAITSCGRTSLVAEPSARHVEAMKMNGSAVLSKIVYIFINRHGNLHNPGYPDCICYTEAVHEQSWLPESGLTLALVRCGLSCLPPIVLHSKHNLT